MNILALEASSGVASAALICDDVLVGEIIINHKKTHSQTLMPIVNQLLNSTEFLIDDVDAFAITVGPGSFTGLRIGLATAKGLAHACKKPLIGVSTLESMAYNLPHCSDLIVPILDARRDQVYAAIYYWENNCLKMHTQPCALSVDELIDIIKREGRKAIFIGDATIRFGDKLKNDLDNLCEFSFANSNMQRASSVGVLAKKKIEEGYVSSYEDILPVYLRKSQAEREYDEKQK